MVVTFIRSEQEKDTNMNTNGQVDLVAEVDKAMQNSVPTPVEEKKPLKWANTEAYRKETGHRFRMTKEEAAKFGETPEGRQAAFEARQASGLLN